MTEIRSKIRKNLSSTSANPEGFKSEYLNCVPVFDGNPNELERYIYICEFILATFYDPESFLNVYFLNSFILSTFPHNSILATKS